MELRSCEEFLVGFCPNEEFFVEGVTIKCPFSHITTERDDYKEVNKYFPHEYKVLENYKQILNEINKKIEIRTRILAKEKIDQEHFSALRECERMIEAKMTQDFDFEKTHSLLILHGKLIQDLQSEDKTKRFNVCECCSAFKEINGKCTHKFCTKYETLRTLVKKLEKKLPKRDFMNESN